MASKDIKETISEALQNDTKDTKIISLRYKKHKFTTRLPVAELDDVMWKSLSFYHKQQAKLGYKRHWNFALLHDFAYPN